MKTRILLLFMILFAGISHAQVAINSAGALPASSAMLDVSSTNKGVLFPQIALDSLKDVTKIANPANGLIVDNSYTTAGCHRHTKCCNEGKAPGGWRLCH